MKRRWLIALSVLCFALSAGHSQELPADATLAVHEWGTFTSIAGVMGKAVVWTPQAEKDDLPGFVEHLQNNRFKGSLRGTVRMETPVLYFYATHPTTVSVQVRFAQGFLTEWYPHAASPMTKTQLGEPIVDLNSSSGLLTWNSISVDPAEHGSFPRETSESRYYAARETNASPVTVFSARGEQHEKFLFYRGVSSFDVPVSATPMNGSRVYVSNLSQTTIPQAILFERRGESIGYRVLGLIHNSAVAEAPEMNSDINSLSRDLEEILVGQGLYADEAHAMIQTWNDSWFEEGTRLLYIVPRGFVDGVLPLKITPAPKVTRVFVGRLEIVTPTTEYAVETAFAHGDRATIRKYGRFLAPILEIMIARSQNKARTALFAKYLNEAYKESYALLAPGQPNLTTSSATPTIIDSQ